jgi:cytochrome b561
MVTMVETTARPVGYSTSQKALHWIIALAVVIMIPMGLYMVKRYVETNYDAITVKIYDTHKLIGFVTLWLVVARLAVRLRHGAPSPAPTLRRWQRKAAAATHALLYLLLLAVPILGWVGASADGTLSMLGGLELPAIMARNDDYGWLILWYHGWAAIGLGALAAVHACAGLAHLLVLKDGVFQRMWPSRRHH